MFFIKFTRIYYLKIYYYSLKFFLIFLIGIFLFLLVHFSWLESKLILLNFLNLFSFNLEQFEYLILIILMTLKNLSLLIPAVCILNFSVLFWLYFKHYLLSFPSYFYDFLYLYCSPLIKEDKFCNVFNLKVLNVCYTVRGFKLIFQFWFGVCIILYFIYVSPENCKFLFLFYVLIYSYSQSYLFLYNNFRKIFLYFLFLLFLFFLVFIILFLNFIVSFLKFLFSL